MTVAKNVASTVARPPMNIYRRPTSSAYWASIRLPVHAGQVLDLPSGPVRVGKNGYLRVSLWTSDRHQAELKAAHLTIAVHAALDQLSARAAAAGQPITPSDIQAGADFMQASVLQADESTHAEALAEALTGREPERLADREVAASVKLPAPGAAGDAQLLAQLAEHIPFFMLQATGKTPTGPITPAYAPFAVAFRALNTALLKRGAGEPVPTPPDPRPAAKAAGFDWSDMLEYYLEAHQTLAAKSVLLYRLVAREMAEFFQCPPAQIKRAQVIEWCDTLTGRLAAKTALTRIRAGHSLHTYALVNLKLGDPEPTDVFRGVTVAGAKSAKSGRQRLELDELAAVFAPPLPCLLLTTFRLVKASTQPCGCLYFCYLPGARREEIAGLRSEDVFQQPDSGVWSIRIRYSEIRATKTGSSDRQVPVHRTLVELGFLDYVTRVHAAGCVRLFPGLARDGGACAAFVVRHIHARLGPLGTNRSGMHILKDLHSLRHTFIWRTDDLLLPEPARDSITGHAAQKMSARYSGPAGQLTLQSVLNTVDYPGVSFIPPPLPSVEDLRQQEAAARRRARAGEARKATRATKLISSPP